MLVFKLSCFVVGLLSTFAQYSNFELQGFDIEVGCPKSWVFSDNACYYFGEGKLNHDAASAKCEAIGGKLFDPDGEKDNTFVKETLTQLNSDKSLAWVNDFYSTSLYGWVPGSGFRGGFKDWAKNPAPEGDGLCMVMSEQYFWRWDALNCSTEQDMLYVCESFPVMVDCYAESCYTLMHNGPMQNDTCHSNLGYYPARIQSSKENDFIKSFLEDAIFMYDTYYNVYSNHPLEGRYTLENGAYVGGSDVETEGKWRYDNGDKVKYTDWVSGRKPADASAGDDCIVLDAAYDYKWQDTECGNPKYVQVCEEENPENPGQSWWWG